MKTVAVQWEQIRLCGSVVGKTKSRGEYYLRGHFYIAITIYLFFGSSASIVIVPTVSSFECHAAQTVSFVGLQSFFTVRVRVA